jgi:hypothetical protein
MALACRFCHPDPLRTQPAAYATVVAFGNTTAVDLEVVRIEQMRVVIPGHCIRCEVCCQYSMISYALACYMHGERVEKDASIHYGNLCRSVKMMEKSKKK